LSPISQIHEYIFRTTKYLIKSFHIHIEVSMYLLPKSQQRGLYLINVVLANIFLKARRESLEGKIKTFQINYIIKNCIPQLIIKSLKFTIQK
jgi:hypothetical protein